MNQTRARPLRPNIEADEKAPVLVKTKFLYLSSENRSSGDINNFNVNLPNDFFTKKKNQIIKLSLNNITITKTWYETRAGVSADYELNGVAYSLRNGSYAVDTLLTELNGLFTNEFIVSYDYPTNKFTYTKISTAPTLKAVNCGYLLGLTDGVLYTGTFTSTNPVNTTYEKTIYVNTNLSGNNALDNVGQPKPNFSTIIATIPIPIAPFDIICHNHIETVNSGIEVAGGQIDSIRVFISTDKNTVPVLFEDFTISLRLEYFNV